jgi:hypothetical protein
MVSKLNSIKSEGSLGSNVSKIYNEIGFNGLWRGLGTRIIMIGTLTGSSFIIRIRLAMVDLRFVQDRSWIADHRRKLLSPRSQETLIVMGYQYIPTITMRRPQSANLGSRIAQEAIYAPQLN